MDIVEFLTAREAEREWEAREAGPSWQRHPACAADDPGVMVFDDDYSYPLVVNPAWVLVDAAAKRAIIAAHPRYEESCDRCDTGESHDYRISADFPCTTLRALAQPYADHPDFDPSWRVETPVR